MSDEKTVWILGSGFSKPLGGPMLPTLLLRRGREAVASLYPATDADYAKTLHGPEAGIVYESFSRGRTEAFECWSDAEEYLDQLDAAAEQESVPPKPGASHFRRLICEMLQVKSTATLRSIRTTARRLIAAECCAFLDIGESTSEKWQPYHNWSQELIPSDTIITFNYDRVLETLDGFDIVDEASDRKRHHPTYPQVLKLHGSVDWRRIDNGEKGVHYVRTDNPRFALTCPPNEIGISTPGPSKQRSTEELSHLWKIAFERLSEADAIVFVGYRFPPTDTEARQRLLSAIEQNHEGRAMHHLNVHVILGPQVSDDVVRLEQLLRWSLRRGERREGSGGRSFAIRTHRMFAEDFFTVWTPEILHIFNE